MVLPAPNAAATAPPPWKAPWHVTAYGKDPATGKKAAAPSFVSPLDHLVTRAAPVPLVGLITYAPGTDKTVGDPGVKLTKGDLNAKPMAGALRCATAPSNANQTLSCAAGETIAMEAAFFGKHQGNCSDGSLKPDPTCTSTASSTLSYYQNRCDGKTSCKLLSPGAKFGTSCAGSSGKLGLRYRCLKAVEAVVKPVQTSAVCAVTSTANDAKIACASGKLKIEAAYFGQQSGSCSALQAVTTCNATGVLAKVKAACENKADCTLKSHKISATIVVDDKFDSCIKPPAPPARCIKRDSFTPATPDCGPRATIKVEAAYYGVQTGSCAAGTLKPTASCDLSGVTQKMATLCDGKHDCTATDYFKLWSDPCFKTEKTFQIRYRCVPLDPCYKLGAFAMVADDFFNAGVPSGWTVLNVPAGKSKTTTCGSIGPLLGGYGALGSSAKATRSLQDMPVHSELAITFGFVKLDAWQGEEVRLLLDNKVIWSKKYSKSDGDPVCGGAGNEQRDDVAVTVPHSAANASLVFVTDLAGKPTVASWGLTNLQVGAITPGIDQRVPEGWSVTGGTLTTSTCGKFGRILGGFSSLGKGAKLHRDLTNLPAHKQLRIAFDFIKVDSWDSEDAFLLVDGKIVWQKKYQYYQGETICGAAESSWKDKRDRISVVVPHTKATAKLTFTSNLNGPATEESWGVDNVQIEAATVGGWGDPCPGKTSQLQVRYSCEQSSSAAQCKGADQEATATSIQCPSGTRIAIDQAYYGLPSGTCGNLSPSKTCNFAGATSKTKALCDGRVSCKLQHYAVLFNDDPCVGVPKRFRVRYACLPVKTPKPKCSLTADYKTAKLSCAGKGQIRVKKAYYGKITGTCGSFAAKSSCDAKDALSKVRAKCENKATCTLPWPHTFIKDACAGTPKQLAMEYTCAGVVEPFTPGVMGTAFAFGGDAGSNFSWRSLSLPKALPGGSPRGAWTIAFWARMPKTSAFSGRNPLLQTAGVASAAAMTLYVSDQKSGHVVQLDNPAGKTWHSAPLRGKTNLADGKWHHIALTFRGLSSYRKLARSGQAPSVAQGGRLTIYVDGKAEVTRAVTTTSGFKTIRLGTVETSQDQPAAANWRKGYLGSLSWIDDVYVYGAALGRSQIRRLRDKAANGLVQVWPPLEAKALMQHQAAWQDPAAKGKWQTAAVVGYPTQDVSPLRAVGAAKGGRVQVPADSSEIGPRTAFTWAGWVRPRSSSAVFFRMQGGSDMDLEVRIISRRLAAVVRSTAGGFFGYDMLTAPYSGSYRVELDRWVFVALVYEGHGGKMKLYADGTLVASKSCQFSKVFAKSPSGRMAQLGAKNSDLVWAALFNRALSRDELVRWRSPGPALWLSGDKSTWWDAKTNKRRAVDYVGAHVADTKGTSGYATYWNGASSISTMNFTYNTGRGYVTVDAKGLLDTDSFTLATWITPDVDGEARLMRRVDPKAAYYYCGDTELMLMCSKSTCTVEFFGQYRKQPANVSGSLYFRHAKFPIPRGKRTHLALVGDDGSLPKLYIDGELAKVSFGGFRVGKCNWLPGRKRGTAWRIGYHDYWGVSSIGAPKSGSLRFESSRIYARKLSAVEIHRLAATCTDLGCSERVCSAGSDWKSRDVSPQCVGCKGNYYDGNDQRGDVCTARLRMHARCVDDEQCDSGTCNGVTGRCGFANDKGSCDAICPQLRRTCVKAGVDGSGKNITYWGCGACLPEHEEPSGAADLSKIPCLWKPKLSGGEACESEFQCKSGVCRSRLEEVYQPWTSSKPKLRNIGGGGQLTMQRYKSAANILKKRQTCGYALPEKCEALHRYSAVGSYKSKVDNSFSRNYTNCGVCKKYYHRAWSLLSPAGCTTLYLQAWVNQWLWNSLPTLSPAPSLQEIKLLTLNDKTPFAAKDFDVMEKKGIGPYMWRIALTSMEDRAALLKKWGGHSIDECFTYDTCSGAGCDSQKNTDSPYFNRAYNRPICVATRYPNGSKCPPPGTAPGSAGHEFCQSGYCSRDNGVCADGDARVYQYAGKARKDNKKGDQSALFSMTQSNSTDVTISEAVKGKLVPKPKKREINSSSSGDFYLIGKDFPVYYLDPVVRCDASKKTPCKVNVDFKVMGFSFPVSPSPVSSCAGGKIDDNGVVGTSPGCTFDAKNFAAQPTSGLCVPVVDFVNKKLLASKSGLSECPKVGACEKCPLSIACEWQAGVVPVKAEAAPVLDVCFDFGLTLSQAGELMFKITPKMGIGAEVKAGVGKDFGIASVFVGIKAVITAISLSMPIGWSTVVGNEVAKNGKPIANLFKVTTHRKVTLELEILAVSLSIFAEAGIGPFSFGVEATLAKFAAITLSFVLSDQELSKQYLDFEISNGYLKSLQGKK